MTPFCAAVDWGTSAFRLWLLAEDGRVLAERRSDEGMIRAGQTGFDAVLEKHLADLGAADGLPVVVCGMAGAKQGWREAGYLDTPADLGALTGRALAVEGYGRDVRILPGIAQRDAGFPDVMRGEETQLLGLAADGVRSGLVCMPGTHSKWVVLQDGAVKGFSTYMTGELFAVLSRHSILRLAVADAAEPAPGDPAFLAALAAARDNPQAVSNLLFSLRSSQLLGFSPSADGAARLSGTLIGLELAGALARHGPATSVVLAGSGDLGALYGSALEASGIAVDRRPADEAVLRGLWSAARAFWAPASGES
jgi:2-dehydro-3-deoxygalactonokinase